jgi:hypothetical protein
LTSALPDLSSNITISGPGANLLSVERDSAAATRFRIFTIASGVTVNISGLTITGGLTADGSGNGGGANVGGNGDSGGGILNGGTLVINGSTIRGNQTGASAFGSAGGGLSLSAGSITLRSTIVAGNSAIIAPDINGTVQSVLTQRP